MERGPIGEEPPRPPGTACTVCNCAGVVSVVHKPGGVVELRTRPWTSLLLRPIGTPGEHLFLGRDCTPLEGSMEKQEETGKQVATPRYKGVRMRKWGKWVAEVRYPNSRQRLWLGSFPTADLAARAYDAAVYCLRGPGEEFNFPDQPPNIPSADKLSRYEIREAAVRHAHEGAKRQGGEEGGGEKVVDPAEGSSGLGAAGEAAEEYCLDFYDSALSGEGWIGLDEDFCGGGGGDDHDDDNDMYGSISLWNF